MQRSAYRARGWTIVELLVILGVIAVILSLLFPTLRRAREAAREIQCTNNLHQLSVGFFQFAVDHDRRLPGGISDQDDPDPEHHDWLMGDPHNYLTAPEGGTLYKYVTNATMYRCPSIEANAPKAGAIFGPLSGSNGRFDYAAVQMFSGARLDTMSAQCRITHTDGSPPQYVLTPLLVEKDTTLINGVDLNGAHTSNFILSHHHHNGSQYAALDGSVNWISEPVSSSAQRGCKLWESYSPSGKWVSLGMLHARWGVWDGK